MVGPLNGSHLASVIDRNCPHAKLARNVLHLRCETITTGRALNRLQSPVQRRESGA